MESTLRQDTGCQFNGSQFVTNGAPKILGGRFLISPCSDRHSLEEIEVEIWQYSFSALADNYELDSIVPLRREKR
jgi:hypothetical protein